NYQLLIQDANELALEELFQKKKHEVFNKPLAELLIQRNFDVATLMSIIKASKNLFSHHVRLYNPNIKKEYDVSVVCLHLEREHYYVVSMRNQDNMVHQSLKSYMDAILDHLPGEVYWKDKEGRYLGCNKVIARMAGFERPEDMIGKTDYDLCW